MYKPTRAIIFLNGDLTDLSRIPSMITKDTLLIGCDGGTRHILGLGRAPDVIIGDFDSLQPDELPPGLQPKSVRHPADKDFTDSEAAIRYAAQAGCQEIFLAGALGTRLDHLLGNIFLLNKDEFTGLKLKLVEGNQEAYIVRDKARISGRKGDTISFIPISGNPQVKTTGGLQYDLNKYTLSLQGNTGISNVLLRSTIDIHVSKGSILVIHQLRSGQ